jgi:hypothetical protein
MRKTNWLLVAICVTAGYSVAGGFVLGWKNIGNFLTGKPNDLNVVGDFVAGMFAPVAVIWLVAAVLTQRQELDEAREQSRLAQDQFKQNQAVIDEQLALIKTQNAMTQFQNQQAVDNAALAHRLNLYDKRIQVFQKFVAIGEKYGSAKWDDDGYWALLNVAQEAAFIFDSSVEEWINEIAQQVYDYQQYCSENRLEMEVTTGGNRIVAKNEKNDRTQQEMSEFTGWIGEQFLPETRMEKFWSFMHVSDRPYLSG